MSTLGLELAVNKHSQETTWLKQANSSSSQLSFAILGKLCNTAAMARRFSDCIILFVLLGLAAWIMLATSAPTAQSVRVRQATTSVIDLNSGVRYSVSYCRSVKVTELYSFAKYHIAAYCL